MYLYTNWDYSSQLLPFCKYFYVFWSFFQTITYSCLIFFLIICTTYFIALMCPRGSKGTLGKLGVDSGPPGHMVSVWIGRIAPHMWLQFCRCISWSANPELDFKLSPLFLAGHLWQRIIYTTIRKAGWKCQTNVKIFCAAQKRTWTASHRFIYFSTEVMVEALDGWEMHEREIT